MARLDRQTAPESPEKNRTFPSFSESKGLLKMPVEGKILFFFGPYRHPDYKVTNFHGGIDIQADRGDPVICVWPGEVVFSDWFRGYGNLIIVNHGDNYHTLYAHLEDRFKIKGDLVEAGEVIATTGDSGTASDTGLHFQVRHHGKALDPLEWINRG
jgi:septal ring factor EnvC (AmiA/AmiB activator)